MLFTLTVELAGFLCYESMGQAPDRVEPPPTINVKDAVAIAIQYFTELFQHPFSDLALEEVEMSDDGRLWLVTLGFQMPQTGSPLAALSGTPRLYKIIKVDAVSAEPKSMKVRKL